MDIHQRVDKIIADYQRGHLTVYIAAKHEITIPAVRGILRMAGIKLRGRAGPTPKTRLRVPAAFRLRAQGKQWGEIADELGFNRGRAVSMACSRHPELAP